MRILSENERHARDFVFFDASLCDTSVSIRRILLLDEGVLSWFRMSDAVSKEDFLLFVDCLKPPALRNRKDHPRLDCRRRAVVGTKQTYEVLCAHVSDREVVLFTPYVSSDIEGTYDVGVLGKSNFVGPVAVCH